MTHSSGGFRRDTRLPVSRSFTKRLRRAQDMTQEQLANAAGLRQALISELESSKLDVRIDTLSRLAIALDASMGKLFDEAKRG
jgi:transcriptional regulator with XRE-family HTH domain